MRSGRGKCPQCKETIVVDLDAAEIRCPYCNALLKKSKKTVAEVRAEEEARIAAAEARERALRGEPEVPAEPVPEPVTEPVAEVPAEPAVETVAEPVVETPAAEVPEQGTAPAAEEAPEQVDEIGISDEELAAMDASVPEETPAASEDAPAPADAVDEIGISDEELAMMDEQVPEETSAEQVPAEPAAAEDALFSDQPTNDVAPAAEDADEPMVFGSIGADEGEQTPEEEDAARVADEETDVPAEEEAPVNNNVTLEDDVDPALLDDDLPMIDSAESEAPAEVVAEPEIESAPADVPPAETDDVAVEDATPTETPVVEAEPVSEVEEIVPAASAEGTPAEIVPVAAPVDVASTPAAEAETEEPYVPTEEDMAFAASLSETNRTPARVGFVAQGQPVEKKKKEKKSKHEPKEAASKGDNKMRGSSVYKKPVALIMMILSILAAAVWFLYYKVTVFVLVSVDLFSTIAETLPTFGEEMFPAYVVAAFAGLIAVVSILGLTGKKGKLGFLFVLLADLVFALVALFGATPLVEIEALKKIVIEYGEYATYAIYGLILIAAVFFAISFAGSKSECDFPGAGAILPVIYMAVVLVGYIALILLPKFVESFSVSADILRYAILGAIGLALLMTLVGVHSGPASRSVNGWLIFAALLAIAVINAVPLVVTKFAADAALDLHEEIPYYLTPIIAIFGVAGFTAADMRN